MSCLERFRLYRTRKLSGVAAFLLRIGLTANSLTAISLLSGLLAVYFLFDNHLIFVIMATIHLAADSLDGVLARHSQTSIFGSYFDTIADALTTLLALLKIAYYLSETYAYLISALFLIVYTAYIISKLTLPILHSRSVVLISLFFEPLHPLIPQLTYLLAGVCILYSGAKMIERLTIRFPYKKS